MYENVIDKWAWGGMDDLENGIYMDENNRTYGDEYSDFKWLI